MLAQSERVCACGCGLAFHVRPRAQHQRFFSRRCRWRSFERTDPEQIARARERNREWCANNRSVKTARQWLRGAPPYGTYLPGGAFDLRITPTPRWPIELRNTRALHGLITELIGAPHHPTIPGFTLIPIGRGCGWGVYIPDAEQALKLAGRQHEGVLFDRDVLVSCGPMHRIKAPKITKRGHRLVKIDVVTPVCIRANGRANARSSVHVTPSVGNLISTIAAWLPRRLGIDIAADAVQAHLIERKTMPQWTPLGGKYGAIGGFVGSIVLDTNATGHWLLACATTLGLGGTTAFGFGRIRLSDA